MTHEVEFSATVTVHDAQGDTDAIIKAAFEVFEKKVRHELRNRRVKSGEKKDLKALFTAIILHGE